MEGTTVFSFRHALGWLRRTLARRGQQSNERAAALRQWTTELAETNAELAREVAGRRRVEKELWQAEAKYRSIFENAVEGIFQTSPDGRYLSVNPDLARIYGYKTREELTTSLTDIGGQLYVNASRRAEFARLLHALSAVDFELLRAAVRRPLPPALIAYARDDHMIEIEVAEELAAAVPGARVVAFDEGGHNIQKTRAVELGAAIREVCV